MSVWATILELQHPDERDAALAGFPVVFVETDEGRAEEERLGSPWAFEHSGVIPERDGLRRGSVSLSSLAAFVEDAHRAVPEEQFRDGDLPWLRLIVRTHPLPDEGDQAIVVLDREQAEAMRDALDGWISRLEAAEPDGGFSASRRPSVAGFKRRSGQAAEIPITARPRDRRIEELPADLAINCPAYACRQAGSKEGRRSLMASEWQQTSSRGIHPISQHHIWGEHGWAERGVGGSSRPTNGSS